MRISGPLFHQFVLELPPTFCLSLSLRYLNLLSLAFLPISKEQPPCLAFLYIDHQERLQLVAHDLKEYELDENASTVFQATVLSAKDFPFSFDQIPRLQTVSSYDLNAARYNGGLLVLGGRKIPLYSITNDSKVLQDRKRPKRQTSAKKKELEAAQKAKGNSSRDERQRKPDALVHWPWAEVSSCVVCHSGNHL